MPEDLPAGVFVEGASFRSGSIEGVPTSTLGMAGATEWGPVPHPSSAGTGVGGPVLVTSMAEYERVYGGFTNRGGALPAGFGRSCVLRERWAASVRSAGFRVDRCRCGDRPRG